MRTAAIATNTEESAQAVQTVDAVATVANAGNRAAARAAVAAVTPEHLLAAPQQLQNATAAETEKAAALAAWVPPDVFKRRSIKYRARPETLAATQVEIVKHIPLLVFGRKRSDRLTKCEGYSQVCQDANTMQNSHTGRSSSRS